MEHRKASIQRDTKETMISVSVDVDGAGGTDIATGIDFLDHIITSFGRHAMLDLEVRAKSNDRIEHHLIEDTAIALGQAVDDALGKRDGIVRFGLASVPMDESLAVAAVDLVRRPFCKLTLPLQRDSVEGIAREDLEHFFLSLLQNMNSCIHLEVRYGSNDHHKAESAMKSLAVALRQACARDAASSGPPSTKGSMG